VARYTSPSKSISAAGGNKTFTLKELLFENNTLKYPRFPLLLILTDEKNPVFVEKCCFDHFTHLFSRRGRRGQIPAAKQLLIQTALPLADVAAQSGFGDQASFTRTFHRIAGASPGRWRRGYLAK